MNLNLLDLAYNLTDEDKVKIILSSGDYFPGFYRFTLGTQTYEQGQLTPSGLLRAYMDEISCQRTYSRYDWMRTTIDHHRTRTSIRNAEDELLAQKYLTWMTTADEYDIAMLEIDNKIGELRQNTTYFFMGSLIRFTASHVKIGYDKIRRTSLMEFRMPFSDVVDYVRQTMPNPTDLFIPAELIASLTFEDDIGSLYMTDDTYQQASICTPNTLVIASNRDTSHDLPIRWAKDIVLTEVANASAYTCN